MRGSRFPFCVQALRAMATKLIDFWPDADNCRDCFFTEAEAADEAVFLAAHQSMKISRHYKGSSAKTEEVVSEATVLEALLMPDPPSGTLVLPITGASGVGKSHVIRWLDANLRLRKDHASRHVVRIPKSASLRHVLELILQDLSKKYDPIRTQLKGAKLPDSLQNATLTLNAQLRIALANSSQTAAQRIKDGAPKKDDRARMAHCSDKCLIALLQDPEISFHFDAHGKELGVIARIADRFLSGKKQQVDVTKFYFQEDDLDFLDKQSAASLSAALRVYAQQLKNPAARTEAIGFLNEMVDSALGKLVEMGGASLTEIFINLRRQLLEDNRELVLLVEDFAVLAGIQGPLMDAMIREAIRNGRQELCVMRTALAVTTGLLPETVMTRAQAEWRIDSKPFESKEEAIDTFCDFVGGYLNAARLGKRRLRSAYDEKSGRGSAQDWIPSFYDLYGEQLNDADKGVLVKFGASKLGKYPLFPLNREAITQLAENALKEGDVYRFDPRAMMHRIIRETVVGHRALFARKEFPPSNFAGFSSRLLETKVSTRLQGVAGDQADRLSALVYFWGAAPQTPGEAAAMPPEIFVAFGAPAIDWKAPPETRQSASAPSKDLTKSTTSTHAPEGRWAPILAEWRAKGIISQRDAAQLRTFLAEGIQVWVDWDGLLLKEVVLKGSDIWLPKAKVGNPEPDKAMAVAAEDTTLDQVKASNVFFTAIKAVVRYDANKSWDYQDGETDAAAYANLISRMAGETREWLMKRGPHLRPHLLEPAARALLIDARVLNLPGAISNGETSNGDADNVQALLTEAPAGESAPGTDPWTKLKASAHNERAALLDVVLRQLAARQGGGEPQAVDATVLLGALKKTRTTWSLSDMDSALIYDAPTGVREPLRRIRNGLEDAVKKRQEEIGKWRTLVTEAFGEQFDLLEVQTQLQETIQSAKENNVFKLREPTFETLRNKIKELTGVAEAAACAAKAIKEGPLGLSLTALAQMDEGVVRRTRELIEIYNRFLKETGADVSERLKGAPPSPEVIAKQLLESLDKLEGDWTGMLKEAKS